MTHAELEKIKDGIYNLTLDNIYDEIAASGLMISDSRLRDAVVCALEEAATHFCTPEFGTDPESG